MNNFSLIPVSWVWLTKLITPFPRVYSWVIFKLL
jgi:hypothetical protein